MNKGPRVFLPRAVAPWLDDVPWATLEQDLRAGLEIEGRRYDLELRSRTKLIPEPSTNEATGLLFAPRFTQPERRAMEDAGLSYVDAVGHLHISLRSVLIHVERASRNRWPVGPSADERLPTLGPASIRVAMAILDSSTELSIAALAKSSGVSIGQTHLTLKRLEDAGLIQRSGRGPHTERTLKSKTQLLDILQAQVLRQRRAVARRVFVYSRRPEELWRHLSDVLGAGAAISGSAGATLLAGPAASLTAVQKTLVRVSPKITLEEAAQRLGAKPADAGANVLLLPDSGGLGTSGARNVDGMLVAPPVCVFLDCLREPRGEDLAQQFRENYLGY